MFAVYESVMKTCGDKEIAISMAISAGRAISLYHPGNVDPKSRLIFDTLQAVTKETVHVDDAIYIASLSGDSDYPDYPFGCIDSALRRNDVSCDGVEGEEENETNELDENGDVNMNTKTRIAHSAVYDIFCDNKPVHGKWVTGDYVEFAPIGIANYVANVNAAIEHYKNNPLNPLGRVERVIYGVNFIAHVYTAYEAAVSPTDEQYRLSNPQYIIKGDGWTSYINLKKMKEKPKWIHGVTFETHGIVMRTTTLPPLPFPVVPRRLAQPAQASLAEPIVAPPTEPIAAPIIAPPAEQNQSVFTNPTRISDMLCVFLGVPPGSLMSRSEVMTRICAYAKAHRLIDRRQFIRADPALLDLLFLTPNDELKILNLPHFLKPHYLRA